MAFFRTGPLYKFGCWSTSLRNSSSFLAAWTRSRPRFWQNGSWYILYVSAPDRARFLPEVNMTKMLMKRTKITYCCFTISHWTEIFFVIPGLHLIWRIPSKLFDSVVNDLERKRKTPYGVTRLLVSGDPSSSRYLQWQFRCVTLKFLICLKNIISCKYHAFSSGARQYFYQSNTIHSYTRTILVFLLSLIMIACNTFPRCMRPSAGRWKSTRDRAHIF